MLTKILGYIYGAMRSAYYQERYKFYRRTYKLNPDFGFSGTDIRIYGNGKLEVAANSYIGTNSTIQLAENTRVVIGFNCQISHNVRIYSSIFEPDQDFTKPKVKPPRTGDVLIGNGVWIGANVFINPGITIGNNVVIGANSVVTKNLSDNGIYGGVPAKLIRYKT